MEDRIPTPGQEGRVKITPESGNPFYAKLEMADNPAQEGTALNKANLLSDATAAKLHGVTTPNAALNLLSASLLKDGMAIKDALGNLITLPSAQLDERVRIAIGSYVGSGSSPLTLTLPFPMEFCVISNNANKICFCAGKNYGLVLTNPNSGGPFMYEASIAISGSTVTFTDSSLGDLDIIGHINAVGVTYDYACLGRSPL